jgi:hypothetical protein
MKKQYDPRRAHIPNRSCLRLFCLASFVFLSASAFAQVPSPKDHLGFTPGDDRKLASWAQIVDYFQKLDASSDRVKFEEIGKTTMGKPFVYATISSPENLKNLEKYKRINARLADPRVYRIARGDEWAAADIKDGKTIVLITHGIHSTEVGSTLSSMLIAHQLALAPHADIRKILDDTIILLVPSLNPDGVDIVKNWYDKTLGTPYEGTSPPELYHKYVGHDNNRDWYSFTQVETQLTVDKIHNVWHPHIVHDIHQQGANGSRLFLPPYMQPVEPNVPKQIVEGYTELGNHMAESMRKLGYQGITTNSTYDAWTPARAYSHYHGGVRILSETASARLASPITVKWEDIRAAADDSYDPKVESPNFGPVWKGGEWKLKNITDYMTTASFALLNHAAANRDEWLKRFYEIGKEAVRPSRGGDPVALAIKPVSKDLKEILDRAQVETRRVTLEGDRSESLLVRTNQPYFAFAKALLESQRYPDLKDSTGAPLAPYDVTAHTLPLLFGLTVTPLSSNALIPPSSNQLGSLEQPPPSRPKMCRSIGLGIYRSEIPAMDEGWTRFIATQRNLERFGEPPGTPCKALGVAKIRNGEVRSGKLHDTAIIFPDQSSSQILNGYAKGSMPEEYTGGVGKEGVENLKKFVEAGGTLVFLNRSSQFAIEQFNLPVKDVTRGLNRKDFYIPGSILRTELDLSHPIAKGMPQQSIAWFENSPAFEIRTDPLALTNNFNIIARYPSDPKQILLSGWALGAEKIAGKAALVEFTVGKGKIILFGFRPQYRGQSLATFPLLFNAISR